MRIAISTTENVIPYNGGFPRITDVGFISITIFGELHPVCGMSVSVCLHEVSMYTLGIYVRA